MAVIKNEENLKKCVCADCPSYDECTMEKEELLYCSTEIGKSACEINRKGCICGTCPVQLENNLISGYYCVTGAPVE